MYNSENRNRQGEKGEGEKVRNEEKQISPRNKEQM